ncbi:hypothetical protein O181_049029 [Austropuccinia psidii MF-1]|uniref:Uncharacterized protein n=1 Tax=Austropuccinia psidii MF-1 TaxID=1389203 RepID=A0A9Q3DU06_9BASI|nr:hypothetical protein [Austropuccinia psidii MF-1]
MRRWGIPRFTMDWDSHWDNRFNQIMTQFFLCVWKWGLVCNRFGLVAESQARSINMDELILMAVYWQHAKSLKRYYKRGLSDQEGLQKDSEANTKRSILFRVYLQDQGVDEQFVTLFDEKTVNSDDEVVLKNESPLVQPKNPFWRSKKGTEFIDWIELRRRRIKLSTGHKYLTLGSFGPGASPRPRQRPNPPVFDLHAHIPIGLPRDFYDENFLSKLSYSEKHGLQMKPEIFDNIVNLDQILPHDAGSYKEWPKEAHIMQIGKGKDKALNENDGEFTEEFDDLGDHQMHLKVEDDD